jgi:signal peptidase II
MTTNRYGLLVLVVLGVVGLDQVTKAWVVHALPLYDSIAVIPGLLNLTHVQNPGGAFGFLAGEQGAVRRVIFLGASALAIVLIFLYYRQTPRGYPWLTAALALIMGGAVGNLVDRLRLGRVIDFIDAYLGNLHWPAFNVADSAITIGMTIVVYHLLFKKMPH